LSFIFNEDIDLTATANPIEKELKWFVINPTVKPLEYVEKINDWAYEITYRVTPYKIPYVRSTYVTANRKTGYYGAHKKYEYLFTGKNTEVVSFETTYNNLYFIPGGMSKNGQQDTSGALGTTILPAAKITGSESLIGQAGAPVGSVTTSLYSPGDTVRAKIQILGDPDYLMTRIGGGPNTKSPKELAYGVDYTINPYGGQVFVEIIFNEGIDYNMQTGLFDVNAEVQFYNGALESTKRLTKGIIYMLMAVNSTFSKGKFMQELELVMWTEVQSSNMATASGREAPSAANETLKLNIAKGFGATHAITPNANQLATVNFESAPTLAQTNASILTAQGISVADDDSTGAVNAMAGLTSFDLQTGREA
jgi:hypothetical protein